MMTAHPYLSFNPMRSIGIPSVTHVKPANMFQSIQAIQKAQVVLFPEYWQVNSLVYALKKQIFPSVSTYHLGHDKVEMTRCFQTLFPGHMLPTGIFHRENAYFYDLADQFGLPFVCKEIRSSSGMGVFLIHSLQEFEAYARKNGTIYVQKYLPIERDLRVVVTGDHAVAAYWRVGGRDTFHNNVSRGARISRKNIPRDIINRVVAIARALGIDYAGFDVAVTDSGFYLFEFNVYFGTKGIPMGSHDIGQAVGRYLAKKYPVHPSSAISPEPSHPDPVHCQA